MQLISLQKADGSWDLCEGLAIVLGMKLRDIRDAFTIKVRFREEKKGVYFRRVGGSLVRIGMNHDSPEEGEYRRP